MKIKSRADLTSFNSWGGGDIEKVFKIPFCWLTAGKTGGPAVPAIQQNHSEIKFTHILEN